MFVAVAVQLFEIVIVLEEIAVTVEPAGMPDPVIVSPTSKFVASSTVMSADPFVVSAVESVKLAALAISAA